MTCDKRGNCARYLMVWGKRQSVSSFPTKEVCDHQMPIEDEFSTHFCRGIPFKIRTLALADLSVRGFEADSIMARFNEDK